MVAGPVKVSFNCFCPEKASVVIIHNANYDAQSLFIRAKPFSRKGHMVVLEQDMETGSFREVYSLASEAGENGDPPLPLAVNEYAFTYEEWAGEGEERFIRSIKSIQVFDIWTKRGVKYPTKGEMEEKVSLIKDEVEGYVVFLNGERIV
jgi:hypothetical protein